MKLKLTENLNNFLRDNNTTPAQLARNTGIPAQTLNNWLSGQQPGKITQVKVVANYFGVSLDNLLFSVHQLPTTAYTYNSDEYYMIFKEIRFIRKN